ncbi:DUF805 domain-containing protein [Vibrio mytili]|uniref:Membrane protein n=1 Tax=Vibrio mytili TaxID=50718 RepID=A0A0C3I3R9_9VIBR|nr:DUF805 domain-containing protein [Vibrio mytili]KIN09685.1 membrane protein [Vibrio mytili]
MLTKELLFSFQGRIGRKTFWIWNVVYYVLIVSFSVGISQLFPAFSYLLLPIFLLILLIPDLAITTKRWHDRDKSIYWLALNIPLILGRMGTPLVGPVSGDTSTPQMLIASVSLICGVWILVECGFLKGTAGPNKYGAEPV